MKKVLGHDGFTYPKSPYAVMSCIQTAARDNASALVFDFFAGSGTTFHATALLNKEDQGCRNSITGTLPGGTTSMV
jgi:adenine-specific DNA-methyltransferase